MSQKLPRQFFDRPTLIVAQELLGKYLVRKIAGKKIEAMITETEAYVGPADLASHASRGRTPRTEVMFGEPGHAYVYMVYGMYHCLNFITEKKGYPAAVLIRGAVIDGHKGSTNRRKVAGMSLSCVGLFAADLRKKHTSNSAKPEFTPLISEWAGPPLGLSFPNLRGPGKLCKYFQIDKKLNKQDITKSSELWVEDRGVKIKSYQIKKTKRIGIDYAGEYKHKPWRFYLESGIR